MRDRDVRAVLSDYLRDLYRADPTTLFLDELGVCCGAARVDVAVVNSHLAGYEIKSEADTLERLPGQLKAYAKVLDQLTLVANTRHIARLESQLPDWCGLVEVTVTARAPEVRELKPAATNADLDAYSVAQLLWRDEALDVLRERDLARGLKSRPRVALWCKLAEALPLEDLRQEVRRRLKARDNWRPGARRTPSDVTSQR